MKPPAPPLPPRGGDPEHLRDVVQRPGDDARRPRSPVGSGGPGKAR